MIRTTGKIGSLFLAFLLLGTTIIARKALNKGTSFEAVQAYPHYFEHLQFILTFMSKEDYARYGLLDGKGTETSVLGGQDDVQYDSAAFYALVHDNIKLGERAREVFPWASEENLPEGVFMNEVLPYASLTERREPWRALFFQTLSYCCLKKRAGIRLGHCLSSLALNTSRIEAFLASGAAASIPDDELTTCLPCREAKHCALWANSVVWNITAPPILFQAASANALSHYSVFEVIKAKNASCTGLALVLVAFLRTIGIPSRIAGVPHWKLGHDRCPHADASPACGNHNWVEVWLDGEWHFLDQRGKVNRIDQGWFYPGFTSVQVAGAMNHSIFATSYAPSTWLQETYPDWYNTSFVEQTYQAVAYFPMVWEWENYAVNGWDVTKTYQTQKGPAINRLERVKSRNEFMLIND